MSDFITPPEFIKISHPNKNYFRENTNDLRYKKYFELLYDKYAPQIFGYLIKQTHTKKLAEEYLIKVFLRIWDNIKTLEDNTEKNIIKILLIVCKPIYKKTT